MAADVHDVVLKGGICKTNICDNVGSYVTEQDMLWSRLRASEAMKYNISPRLFLGERSAFMFILDNLRKSVCESL